MEVIVPRYFTHYWQNGTVERHRASGHSLLEYAASNVFVDRGVNSGDVVYPVTVLDGELYLVGRLEVERVCDAAKAEERLGYKPFWTASDYVIAADPTPMQFDLEVSLEMTRGLRFVTDRTSSGPKFSSPGRLDQQTMRGVRELTPDSAAELDRLLSANLLLSAPHIPATPQVGPQLKPYGYYSREEVHDIFAPETPFTSQRGTWGPQGIVAIPNRPGDYVFFVTLGQQQGEHVFDEGITEDGVLSWQSQPRQDLESPQISEFIEHDELTNSIYLFFRTKRGAKYTYLGRLKYLSHDSERENPVYFQWQILAWDPPEAVLEQLNLTLQSSGVKDEPDSPTVKNQLQQIPPPLPSGKEGKTTAEFKAYKTPDYSEMEAKNRELGLKGELLVVEHEKRSLTESGRSDLAEMVRHVSIVEGDGAGYDVESFTPDGEVKYIEVKTTRGTAQIPFYITANEVEFSKKHPNNYYLYRVCHYKEGSKSGKFYIDIGSVEEVFQLTPTQYRAVRS
jgi:Domain of unknown function (DUF3883)/Domain of unknown function (DUF3427)